MIIGACGFGSTGSSIVTDYLKEYEHIAVKDDLEFTWVSKTDGLVDLERAVMSPHNRTGDSIVAIRRFEAMAKGMERRYEMHGLSRETFRQLIKRFIDNITMVKWHWDDSSIKFQYSLKYLAYYIMRKKIIPRLEKRIGHHVKCWPLKEVKMSIMPDNFYSEAIMLFDDMLKALGLD